MGGRKARHPHGFRVSHRHGERARRRAVKDPQTYMLKLVGEILTGEQMEGFTNHHMERGKVMEDEARDLYAFMKDVSPECVGFIRNGDKGCSARTRWSMLTAWSRSRPSCRTYRSIACSAIGSARTRRAVPGCLWVAEREWIDFVSYWPKLPLFVTRTYRDDDYIAKLAAAVDQFNAELAELVETIRNRGDGFASNSRNRWKPRDAPVRHPTQRAPAHRRLLSRAIPYR
jgi:hypothetical protein